MRILLALGETNDPTAASDYVAARFDGGAVEIDVLTVARGADGKSGAQRVAAAAAERLGEHHGFRPARAHVRHGNATDEIVAASETWRSALVLIGAPRQRGLLTAFGVHSVARGVSARAHCPVELIRAHRVASGERNRVVTILDVERLDEFPFEQLERQSLAWSEGSSLRIVGVQTDALERFGVEANAAALLRSLERSADDREWARARLASACRALAESFGSRVSVDYSLVDGSTRDVAIESAETLGASLLVLDSAATDRALRGSFSRPSPAAITMAAPCSVLLLRTELESHARVEPQPAPYLTPFSQP